MFDQNGVMNNGYSGAAGNYNYQGYGYNNGAGVPVQKHNNALTADQIKKLQQNVSQFSLALTEEEYLRAICTHRNAEGTADTLVYDPMTGMARCTICGYEFKPVDANVSKEEVKGIVDDIINVLQTTKLMYIDLPAEAAAEYYPIIALLNKAPQLFEFAAKNLTKHEANNWQFATQNVGAMNMLNNLQSMFAGGMPMQPQGTYAPQQMMGQPVPNMPAGYPTAAYGNPAMSNGFGYPGANPAMGYQPQTANYQFTPPVTTTPAQTTVPAPAAPVQAEAEKDQTTVTQPVTV